MIFGALGWETILFKQKHHKSSIYLIVLSTEKRPNKPQGCRHFLLKKKLLQAMDLSTALLLSGTREETHRRTTHIWCWVRKDRKESPPNHRCWLLHFKGFLGDSVFDPNHHHACQKSAFFIRTLQCCEGEEHIFLRLKPRNSTTSSPKEGLTASHRLKPLP